MDTLNEKHIKDALLKGERVTLECKKAQSSIPGSVWETYSAFANTYGGLILLGVYENLKEKDISKRFTFTFSGLLTMFQKSLRIFSASSIPVIVNRLLMSFSFKFS